MYFLSYYLLNYVNGNICFVCGFACSDYTLLTKQGNQQLIWTSEIWVSISNFVLLIKCKYIQIMINWFLENDFPTESKSKSILRNYVI